MSPIQKKRKLTSDIKVTENIISKEPNEDLSHTKAQRDPRTLFVRNLSTSTTSDDLTIYFSQSYPLKHATAVIDSETNQCKGFGFVTFRDAEDANIVVQELNGTEFNGKKLIIELAQSRQRNDNEDIQAPKLGKPIVEKQPPPKIIVRNLPWSVNTVEKVTKLFLSYGRVREAILPKMHDGKLRGFAIVLLKGHKNAKNAITSLNGKELDGRYLAVDWAADKETWKKEKEKEKNMQLEASEADQQRDKMDLDVDDNNNNDDDDDESDVEPLFGPESISDDLSNEELEADDDDGEDIESSLDTETGGPSDSEEDDQEDNATRPDRTETTIFIRNLPFTCTDEDLGDHFNQFGFLRYSRVVYDPVTEKPRGTGFVCFVNKDDFDECVKNSPKSHLNDARNNNNNKQSQSILQDVSVDSSGKYTLEGRVLIISKAVNKSEAEKLTQDGINFRNHRDKDKRNLFLLREGHIPSNSPLYTKLSPSEIKMREASSKQRKDLVEKNPSLHLSLTRLAIRNIPKYLTSKDLKQYAREGVVKFSKDVKEQKRLPLSKEELSRGGDEMKQAEIIRKKRGKGIVKQAKVVFESKEGSKVSEAEGTGRSRGYGFIEYYTHRNALMGLRWLNGHEIQPAQGEKTKEKKRLIVEFALENVKVINRRKEREITRASSKKSIKGDIKAQPNTKEVEDDKVNDEEKQKLIKRQQIIQKKRMARRARKKGKT